MVPTFEDRSQNLLSKHLLAQVPKHIPSPTTMFNSWWFIYPQRRLASPSPAAPAVSHCYSAPFLIAGDIKFLPAFSGKKTQNV